VDGGGIETLFLLNSGILAWASIFILERRLINGCIAVLVGAIWWTTAIGGGFAAALLIAGSLPSHPFEMVVFCMGVAMLSGASRAYLSDLL